LLITHVKYSLPKIFDKVQMRATNTISSYSRNKKHQRFNNKKSRDPLISEELLKLGLRILDSSTLEHRRIRSDIWGYRGGSPTAVRLSDPALCGSCPL